MDSLVPAFSTLSRPCAIVMPAGSLFGGKSDAGVLNSATLFRLLVIVKRQRDAIL